MPLVVIRSETLKRGGGGDKILEIEKQKESVVCTCFHSFQFISLSTINVKRRSMIREDHSKIIDISLACLSLVAL